MIFYLFNCSYLRFELMSKSCVALSAVPMLSNSAAQRKQVCRTEQMVERAQYPHYVHCGGFTSN